MSPASAASLQMSPSHGQPLALAQRSRSSLPILMAVVHIAVVRRKPHSKLYDNWDTDVAGVIAMVSVGRRPQISFHLLHTNAKYIYPVSSTKSAMCEMISTLSTKGLFLVEPCLREINLKAICSHGGQRKNGKR